MPGRLAVAAERPLGIRELPHDGQDIPAISANATSTDSSVTVAFDESPELKANTAGTNSPTRASSSSAAFEPAISRLNRWIPLRSPPTSSEMPRTSSRLPMIEPVIDALTTVIRPAWSAKKAMISSAMLPNVALRMPPICGPVIAPSRSVASPTTHASPRIPSADTRNSGVPSTWNTTSRTIAMTAMATVASTPIRAPRPSGPRIGIPTRC